MRSCASVCVCMCVRPRSYSPQSLGACTTVCEGVDVHFVDGYESITLGDLATLSRWAPGYQRAHLRNSNPVHVAARFFCTRFCCTSWQTCRPPSGLPTKTIPTPASCVLVLDSNAAFLPAHVTSLLATAALTAQSCHPRNPCACILAQATARAQTSDRTCKRTAGQVFSWVVVRTPVLQSTSAPLFTRLDLAASETGEEIHPQQLRDGHAPPRVACAVLACQSARAPEKRQKVASFR